MTTVIERIAAAQAHAAAVRPAVSGFPYLAEALRGAGVTRCHFDVPSRTFRYVTTDGSVLHPGALLVDVATMVPRFDRSALVEALRADQRGETAFREFVAACWRAGVVRTTCLSNGNNHGTTTGIVLPVHLRTEGWRV